MQTKRRNSPARSQPVRSETAQINRTPARGDMNDSRDPEEPDAELESDPIVAELRRLYDGVVDEPLPNDLMELLRKLDEVERNR